MYNLGEIVVNKESFKQGTVSEIDEGHQKIEIRYEDGSSEWVDLEGVAKLLLDEGPKGNFIQD